MNPQQPVRASNSRHNSQLTGALENGPLISGSASMSIACVGRGSLVWFGQLHASHRSNVNTHSDHLLKTIGLKRFTGTPQDEMLCSEERGDYKLLLLLLVERSTEHWCRQ